MAKINKREYENLVQDVNELTRRVDRTWYFYFAIMMFGLLWAMRESDCAPAVRSGAICSSSEKVQLGNTTKSKDQVNAALPIKNNIDKNPAKAETPMVKKIDTLEKKDAEQQPASASSIPQKDVKKEDRGLFGSAAMPYRYNSSGVGTW